MRMRWAAPLLAGALLAAAPAADEWRWLYPAAAPPAANIGADCAACHLAGGAGRLESASLAGLPADYLVAQVRAFRSGQRRAAVPDWGPSVAMAAAVARLGDAEIAAAVQGLAGQRFVSRVKVVESATAPATEARGHVLIAIDGPRQPIAGRIIEVPDDLARYRARDPALTYTAWVPPGSLARGAALAEQHACLECHSSALDGWGPGRSPSYILRQLLAFKSGARADAGAAPMQAVVAELGDADMVDVAAFLAAQPPVE